ncbi:MAG: phage holin family protein [Frankiaceae bacterium]
MPSTVVGGKPVEDQTVGQLFAGVSRDLSLLIHDEIELAKTELKVDAKRAGLGAGFLGGAGFLALLAGLFLSIALAFAFHGLGLPLGVGFLIVGVLYLLLAGGLALGGIKSMKKVSPPKRTIQTVKDDIAWAKNPTVAPATGDGVRPAH